MLLTVNATLHSLLSISFKVGVIPGNAQASSAGGHWALSPHLVPKVKDSISMWILVSP